MGGSGRLASFRVQRWLTPRLRLSHRRNGAVDTALKHAEMDDALSRQIVSGATSWYSTASQSGRQWMQRLSSVCSMNFLKSSATHGSHMSCELFALGRYQGMQERFFSSNCNNVAVCV